MSEEEIKTEGETVDYEAEARKQNWVPKEEFRGAESEWVDAQTFVERGRQINPILRANNERLMRELDKTKKQMEEIQKTADEFRTFQEEQYKRKAEQLEHEIKHLREEKKQAITSGDGERAVEIDERIDALKEEKQQAKEVKKDPAPAAEAEAAPDPILAGWLEKNKWYGANVRMAAATNVIAEDIKQSNPYITGEEFFKELDKALEEVFPAEKLGRKKAPRSPVEGASNNNAPTGKAGKQSYENLPDDAKRECDRFVKQIKGYTREKYIQDYAWD